MFGDSAVQHQNRPITHPLIQYALGVFKTALIELIELINHKTRAISPCSITATRNHHG